jgi:CubicO group peptidase (beta-lactamase class C family)
MKKILFVLIVLGLLLAVSPLYIQRGITRNFSNVTDYKFFDNNIVKAGAPQPWNVAADMGKNAPSDVLLKKIEDNKTIAFLVIQNDSIRYEKYWNGYSAGSYSGSFSMAKSIVSLLMGVAIEERKIGSVDEPISKYVKEFKKPGTDTITIKELLAMSGGFNWKESYINIFGKTANAYYGDDLKDLIGNLEAERTPGVKFEYSSNETQILGWILENVYKKPLSDIASEKIWSKIGAEHDALWSTDVENGTVKAFCCFNSNARDFARLGKLVLQNGRWDSTQIIPAAYVKEATTAASWLKDDEGKPVDFYGYQFWITERKGMKIPYFRGVLGQFIFVIPEKNAVVVRLGEYVTRERVHYTPPDVFTYLDAALEVLK